MNLKRIALAITAISIVAVALDYASTLICQHFQPLSIEQNPLINGLAQTLGFNLSLTVHLAMKILFLFAVAYPAFKVKHLIGASIDKGTLYYVWSLTGITGLTAVSFWAVVNNFLIALGVGKP